MQSLRTGAGHRDGLVKRMDPDAISREEGRGLASDDSVRFRFIAFTPHTEVLLELRKESNTIPLWLPESRETRRSRRPLPKSTPAMAGSEHTWLAIIPMEGNLFVFLVFVFARFITDRSPAAETLDDDVMDSDDNDAWMGNRQRKLWKSACVRAALNVCSY